MCIGRVVIGRWIFCGNADVCVHAMTWCGWMDAHVVVDLVTEMDADWGRMEQVVRLRWRLCYAPALVWDGAEARAAAAAEAEAAVVAAEAAEAAGVTAAGLLLLRR